MAVQAYSPKNYYEVL